MSGCGSTFSSQWEGGRFPQLIPSNAGPPGLKGHGGSCFLPRGRESPAFNFWHPSSGDDQEDSFPAVGNRLILIFGTPVAVTTRKFFERRGREFELRAFYDPWSLWFRGYDFLEASVSRPRGVRECRETGSRRVTLFRNRRKTPGCSQAMCAAPIGRKAPRAKITCF